MLSPSGSGAFPAANSPQRLSSDAKGRIKVALKPGRSLMDWIRLSKSGKDLQGFSGKCHTVSKEELANHNKEKDCWMAIRGKVYNITPYLEYHPGGIPEILRGIGQDGTELFDEVHKWVNVESMLASCFIGPLSASPKATRPSKTSTGSNFLKVSDNLTMPPPNGIVGVRRRNEDKPRYDWFQNDDQVFLSLYTKNANVTTDDVIVDCDNRQHLEVKILLGEQYYTIRRELAQAVKSVRVKALEESSGKVEIVLTKEKPGERWETLGCELEGDDQLKEEKNRDLKFRECIIKTKERVTHDTYLFGIQLPELVTYSTPIGHHCIFKTDVEGVEITRSYTVAIKSLFNQDTESSSSTQYHLHFMIKIYDDGIFTSYLGKLEEGSSIMMSDCTGNFKLSRLKKAKDIYLIAAGTGLTPMLRVINYCLFHREEVRLKLLFANRTEEDILWKSFLDEAENKFSERFSVTYIVSRPSNSWKGLRGRIEASVVADFLAEGNMLSEKRDEGSPLVCICGPTEFTHSIKRFVIEAHFNEKSIHCFLG